VPCLVHLFADSFCIVFAIFTLSHFEGVSSFANISTWFLYYFVGSCTFVNISILVCARFLFMYTLSPCAANDFFCVARIFTLRLTLNLLAIICPPTLVTETLMV
jgi:hypothetical protein